MDISGRLKAELEERDWSTRRFQQEVRQIAPNARGTSYASVYEYVDGRTDPPLSFLAVAAKVLNLRPAWLAFGDEPKSPVDVSMARTPSTAAKEKAHVLVRDASALVLKFTWGSGDDLMVKLVHDLVSAQPVGSPELSDKDLNAAAEALQNTIFGTLNALTKKGAPRADTQFVLASILAMFAVVPKSRQGRPLHEVLKLLPRPREDFSTAEKKAMKEYESKHTTQKKGAG